MFVTTVVNGQYSNAVASDDRGLAYGDGLFETVKVKNGKAVYLAEHLLRLEKGCNRLSISYDRHQITSVISQLLAKSGSNADEAVLKIILTREASGRSYQTHRHVGVNSIISLSAGVSDSLFKQKSGVSVMVCNTTLSINPAMAGIKHLCRLENVLARAEWNTDKISEGLLLDTQGRLIEGTMSNVFLVKDKCLYTPALSRCGVEGIIRQQIITKSESQFGVQVCVCDLTLDDMYLADELFICNSLIGVWPIISVGCHQKSIGNITRMIQHFLMTELGEF